MASRYRSRVVRSPSPSPRSDKITKSHYSEINDSLQRLKKPQGVQSWEIKDSQVRGKKYAAIVNFKDGSRKTVNFGSDGMSDFTIHMDEDRRQRFVNRFRKLIIQKQNDPTSPMFYSYYLLWYNPAIRDF